MGDGTYSDTLTPGRSRGLADQVAPLYFSVLLNYAQVVIKEMQAVAISSSTSTLNRKQGLARPG